MGRKGQGLNSILKEIESQRNVQICRFPNHKHVLGLMLYKKQPYAWLSVESIDTSLLALPSIPVRKRKIAACTLLQQHLQGTKGLLLSILFLKTTDKLYYTKLKSVDEYPFFIEKYSLEEASSIPATDFLEV